MGWGSWNKFWDRVEKNFDRVVDQVQAEQDRWIDDLNMDKVFGSDVIDWMRKNGPLTAAFWDTTGMGLGIGHASWDRWEPPENLQTWNGQRYAQHREGFVADFSYEAAVTDLLIDPNDQAGSMGAHTYFVGHLPDAEFDELTMTMHGGDFDESEESSAFVGANVYQLIDPDGKDRSGIRTVSGYEEKYSEDDPERIYRSSLRLPWKSSTRVSETYGGPTLPRVPTFIQLYAAGVDASTPTVDDWNVQVTARFICNTVR